MTKTGERMQGFKRVSCPAGVSWANLKAELRAIWESNVKVWKIELAYPISFLRECVQPLVMLLPFLLYGLILIGGRYSEALQGLLGTVNPVDVVTYIFTGYWLWASLEPRFGLWGSAFEESSGLGRWRPSM